MSEPETLPEMAERLHGNLYLDSPNVDQQRHNIGLIHAALREVEARAHKYAHDSVTCLEGVFRDERNVALRRLDIKDHEYAREKARAKLAEAENARLRDALSELLESPASFEDSRLDYAERQVDTKVWDEAKAALAAPVEEPKP